MGNNIMRHFFDDIGFGGGFHQRRPQTARPYYVNSKPQRSYKQQQQEEYEQKQKRVMQHRIREAAEKLMRYGFTDTKAVYEVLREVGTTDLKAAIRLLVEREEEKTQPPPRKHPRQQRTTTDTATEETPTEQSPEPESTDEEYESEDSSDPEEESDARIEADPSVAEANKQTEAILREAHELKVPDLNRVWRETKMLNGVPVDLIGYEEGLLRLQMRLDSITADDDSSEEVKAEVRSLRKNAVRVIQQNLDKIDDIRSWWVQQDCRDTQRAESNSHPVAVA